MKDQQHTSWHTKFISMLIASLLTPLTCSSLTDYCIVMWWDVYLLWVYFIQLNKGRSTFEMNNMQGCWWGYIACKILQNGCKMLVWSRLTSIRTMPLQEEGSDPNNPTQRWPRRLMNEIAIKKLAQLHQNSFFLFFLVLASQTLSYICRLDFNLLS